MEGVAQRSEGLGGRAGKGGVQRLFRVGARFPLIANGELACDARNSIEVASNSAYQVSLT